MTSAQDFMMAFAKAIVHNVDTRPQIVQQWTEKLEAREAEIREVERKSIITKSWSEDVNGDQVTIKDIRGNRLLAGQEWYERFEKETGSLERDDFSATHWDSEDVLAAARRAAGLE